MKSLICIATVLIAAAVFGAEPNDNVVTSHIPRTEVDSSGIKRVGFSNRKHILELEFTNGGVYRYLNVPPSVYRDLMKAESKTRYYDQFIKRNYQSQRVRPRVKDQPKN